MNLPTERFKELTKKEKLMLGTAAVCLVIFIYMSIAINPILDSIKPLKKEIEDLKYKVSDLGSIDSTLSELKESYEHKKKAYEKAAAVLPKSDRYPQLIRDIDNYLALTSLQLKSISNTEGIPYTANTEDSNNEGTNGQVAENQSNGKQQDLKAGLNAQTVAIVVEGSYGNILDFVDKLERGERICSIGNLTIASEGGKSVGSIIVTYFYGIGGEEESYNFNIGSYGNGTIF